MTESSVQPLPPISEIQKNVSAALAEDIGTGDITAKLIPAEKVYRVKVVCKEPAVICGKDWVDETFKQVDPALTVQWLVNEGDKVSQNYELFFVEGNAQSILTAERTALNFLQMLSGVATLSKTYSDLVSPFKTQILDTRKTIPGLRLAQKYAVACGGCSNHRIGLYDAYLIKENHIAACGSIEAAIETAREQNPDKQLEIEVESLEEFERALSAAPDIIMLDELSLEDMRKAVELNNGQCKLEASGNMSRERIAEVASTGVDFISIGALTKHIRAIDLSMRFIV